MNKYSYNNLTIEIFNDSTFSINSNDNLEVYENIYFGDDAKEYPTSKHGIKLIDNYKEDGTYYNAKKEWEALNVLKELAKKVLED